MYETKQETAGLRSGFIQAKPPQRVECVSASVLYEGQRSCASLQREGARARRQTRTGCRQNFQSNDDEILAGKPLVIRWLLERHPDLNIETRKSIYDTKKEG